MQNNPSKNEAQKPGRANGPLATNQNTPADITPDQPMLANLKAQLALAGHAVYLVESGYLVCRWGQSRVCSDLAALQAFARMVGARA